MAGQGWICGNYRSKGGALSRAHEERGEQWRAVCRDDCGVGPRRQPESEIGERHKNIAYAVQDALRDCNDERGTPGAGEDAQQNLCLAAAWR